MASQLRKHDELDIQMAKEARHLREQAEMLPPGELRTEVIRTARLAELYSAILASAPR